MGSLLTKFAVYKAVGLHLGEHEVTVCKLASTPVGPVEIASSSEPCTPENLAEVIGRLLTPLVGRRRRVPVAVGLAGSRLFFGTRLTSTGGEIKPEAELQKALCSSNLSADDLVVDLLRGKVGKTPVARMAACRAKYMSGVVAILSRLGVRPFRAEPAACALVRLAERQHRAPRWSKTVLRVFLGASQGLATVVVGGLPVSWKSFMLPTGSEGFAILSVARGLAIQQRYYGLETPPEYVMIHGRSELQGRLQEEQLPTELGTRVIWRPDPALDGTAIAFGLALGCLAQDIKAFDLSRTLKASPPIKEIFPWKESAFAAALTGCMGMVLGEHSMKLDESYVALRAENSQHVCLAAATPAQLEKDKKALSKKVEAVGTFLKSRMLWSAYTHDISKRLPAGAVVTALSGKNALPCGEKTKPGPGSFQLRGKAPLSQDGSIPGEINGFLSVIPGDPLWKRDFASVITDIKLPMSDKKEASYLNFTITGVCKDQTASGSKNKKAAKAKK